MPEVRQRALLLIEEEHHALRRVLRSISRLVGAAARNGSLPDFARLDAMLGQVSSLPVKGHHIVESEVLFPLLRQRCPALGPVLDRLEADHSRVEALIAEVQRTKTAWRLDESGGARASFEAAIKRFVEESLGHVQVEDDYILPVAESFLTPSDWCRLEDDMRAARMQAD